MQAQTPLKAAYIETPIGNMFAVSDQKTLYHLIFSEESSLASEIAQWQIKIKTTLVEGSSEAIASVQKELQAYFKGTLRSFETPLCFLLGTPFQKATWKALMHIPYAKTSSYLEQAKRLGKPTAYRAVANANGANPIAILIPCHRIIRDNGELGGYGGGIARKQWLIDHEKCHEPLST